MATLDYSDLMMVFNDLKKSIDSFHSVNAHLEKSGVFCMGDILTNCEKMEAFLKCDFEVLWRLENQMVKELRHKLETIPVEVVKAEEKKQDSSFDDMPPLFREPGSITCAVNTVTNEADVSAIEQDANAAFCNDDSRDSKPPVPQSTFLRAALWNYLPSPYNPIIGYAPNQQVRDL